MTSRHDDQFSSSDVDAAPPSNDFLRRKAAGVASLMLWSHILARNRCQVSSFFGAHFFCQNTKLSGFNDICNIKVSKDIVSEKCPCPNIGGPGPRPGPWAGPISGLAQAHIRLEQTFSGCKFC